MKALTLLKKYKNQITTAAAVIAAIMLVILIGLMVACSNGEAAKANTPGIITGTRSSLEVPESQEEDAGDPQELEQSVVQDGSESADVASLDDNGAGGSVVTPSGQSTTPSATSNRSNQPAANSDASAQVSRQQRWVEDTKQVWVEDKAAWTEQVPIYSTTEVSICNVCGQDITGNVTAHSKAHMLAGEGSGHHSEVRQTITGYNTVNHPAEGHWETRVTGGHWE